MFRLEPETTSDAKVGFGTLFSTVAAVTSPVQGVLGRPAYRDVAQFKVRSGSLLGGALDLLLGWHERARQRRQLLQMDEHMLRDIGITRADAQSEADKPFWRG